MRKKEVEDLVKHKNERITARYSKTFFLFITAHASYCKLCSNATSSDNEVFSEH